MLKEPVVNFLQDLLFAYGARAVIFKKKEVVFVEGEKPRFFFQVLEGSIKMYNINDDGKEFTQGIFKEGCSFGEPPLFINELYPATAVANENSVVLKLSKENFYQLLTENQEVNMLMIKRLSHRLFNKSFSLKEYLSNTPEQKIHGFLSLYKKEQHITTQRILIPYTRQQIANFVGLRVETVIRALIKMNGEGKIYFDHKKIFY